MKIRKNLLIGSILLSSMILVSCNTETTTDPVIEAIAHKIEVNIPENGTVTVDKTEAKEGETVNIEVSSNENCKFDSIEVTNCNVVMVLEGSKYSFVMPEIETSAANSNLYFGFATSDGSGSVIKYSGFGTDDSKVTAIDNLLVDLAK
jgi:hypothetical protein